MPATLRTPDASSYGTEVRGFPTRFDHLARVAADGAYQNALANSDKQNARIEHDKALGRVMTALLKDDTELFKQFSDNESFRRWLTDTVFGLTYAG